MKAQFYADISYLSLMKITSPQQYSVVKKRDQRGNSKASIIGRTCLLWRVVEVSIYDLRLPTADNKGDVKVII